MLSVRYGWLAQFRAPPWGTLAIFGLIGASLLPVMAAEPASKPFSIEAADAATTLERFSAQADAQIVYLVDQVRGVKTKAVQGTFTPFDALQRMLKDTELHIVQNEKTGVLAVRRINSAPSGPKSSRPVAAVEPPMLLSAFEVLTSQYKGYSVNNAGQALKTNESLMTIPQAVTVITRDLIDDLSSLFLSDILNYGAGASNFFQGESAALRGLRVNILADEAPDGSIDPVFMDSVQVVRGPAAVLYGLNASLGGLILKNSRKPLPTRSATITVRVDQEGYHRAELDATGPVGLIGNTTLRYRFDFANQEGPLFLRNLRDERTAVFGVVEFNRHDTTLRLSGYVSRWLQPPHKNNFITPDGKIYVGADRAEGYEPPGMNQRRLDSSYKATLLQRLWPGWEMKLFGQTGHSGIEPTGVMLGNQVNYQTDTIRFGARRNDQKSKGYFSTIDVIGKYHLWFIDHQSTFGLLYQEGTTDPSSFLTDNAFGALNGQTGSQVSVPLDHPNIDSIVVRKAGDYPSPVVANPITSGVEGGRGATIRTNLYFQQTVQVIPKRLTLVGSLAQFDYRNRNESNIEAIPRAVVYQRQQALLHRFGAVANVTDEIMIYALESTTMAPQASRLIDGSTTSPQQGRGREIGFKLMDGEGRISATVGVFDIQLSNVAVAAPTPSPVFGGAYATLIGKAIQKGWDANIFLKPLPNWQMIVNYYRGTVKDQDGGPVANSYRGAWSLFTRYDFQADALKKFSVGLGANRIHARLLGNGTSAANAAIVFPDGQFRPFIQLKDGTMTMGFINYTVSKRWMLRLNVNNLLDEKMILGAQNPVAIDPSPPRTFIFSAVLRF